MSYPLIVPAALFATALTALALAQSPALERMLQQSAAPATAVATM